MVAAYARLNPGVVLFCSYLNSRVLVSWQPHSGFATQLLNRMSRQPSLCMFVLSLTIEATSALTHTHRAAFILIEQIKRASQGVLHSQLHLRVPQQLVRPDTRPSLVTPCGALRRRSPNFVPSPGFVQHVMLKQQ